MVIYLSHDANMQTIKASTVLHTRNFQAVRVKVGYCLLAADLC